MIPLWCVLGTRLSKNIRYAARSISRDRYLTVDELYHSIHAKGEDVEDVLKEAETAGVTGDAEEAGEVDAVDGDEVMDAQSDEAENQLDETASDGASRVSTGTGLFTWTLLTVSRSTLLQPKPLSPSPEDQFLQTRQDQTSPPVLCRCLSQSCPTVRASLCFCKHTADGVIEQCKMKI